jgi:hypothetical protein
MSLDLKLGDEFSLGPRIYYYRYTDKEGNLIVRINPKRKRRCIIQIITLDGIEYYYREIKDTPITAYKCNDATKYHIGCISLDGINYYYMRTNGNFYHDSDNVYTKSGQQALTNLRWDSPIRTKELRSVCTRQGFGCTSFNPGLTLSFLMICTTTKKIMRISIPNIYKVYIDENSSPFAGYIMFYAIYCVDDKYYYFGNAELESKCHFQSNMLFHTSHRSDDGKKLYDWLPDTLDPSIVVVTISEINSRKYIIYLSTLTIYKDGIMII